MGARTIPAMQFGGRELPLSLRVGRMLVYLQVGLLLMIALFAIVIMVAIGGGSGGLQFNATLVSGNWTYTILAVNLTLSVLLVWTARGATSGAPTPRYLLAAAEVVVAAYFVFFSGFSLFAWIEGPVLAAAVLWLHFGPEASAYLGKLGNGRGGLAGKTESAAPATEPVQRLEPASTGESAGEQAAG